MSDAGSSPRRARATTARPWPRTARELAAALGHPDFRAGVLSVTRAQLLWRTNVGGSRFNHVHRDH